MNPASAGTYRYVCRDQGHDKKKNFLCAVRVRRVTFAKCADTDGGVHAQCVVFITI